MAAYASSDDLVARYSEPMIADLVVDGDTPEPQLSTNDAVLAALAAASGRIESACSVAGMYAPDDLAALTGNSLALLKELTCDLAFVRLMRRKPTKYGEDQAASMVKETEEYLDRLRKGERLFFIEDAGHVEAGKPSVDGPTVVTFERLNLITSRVRNFYPPVGSRLPIGRGG